MHIWPLHNHRRQEIIPGKVWVIEYFTWDLVRYVADSASLARKHLDVGGSSASCVAYLHEIGEVISHSDCSRILLFLLFVHIRVG